MASSRKTATKKADEVTAKGAEDSLPEMSLADVKTGDNADKCYIAVDGFVCDVTEYLPDHPGSEEQLLDVAGTDATEEFFDHSHSAAAVRKMKKLAIGKLPDGVGQRKGGAGPAASAESSSSGAAPVIGIVLLLLALVAYVLMTQQ